MRPTIITLGSLALLFGSACRESRLVMTPNKTPVAVAQAKDPKTGKLSSKADDLVFPYNGQDVEVTLDGSGSHDDDGEIVTYRWLSGTAAPDGGPGRYLPPGVDSDWPDDKKQVTVKLPEGAWTFALWVIDNEGGVSDPSTVTVTVGSNTQACVSNVYDMIPEACSTCLCGASATCATAVQLDKCDATCWGLVECIAAKCPTFAMDMNITCVTSNCGAFLGGSTGAMGITPCLTPCLSACASVLLPGAGGGAEDGGAPADAH